MSVEITTGRFRPIAAPGTSKWTAEGGRWRLHGTQISSFFNVRDSVHMKRGILGDYHLSSDRVGKENWVLITRVH